MKTFLLMTGLTLASVLASVAPNAPVRAATAAPAPLTDIRWSVTPRTEKRDATPRLRMRSHQSSTDLALDGARAELGAARRALGGGAGLVSFSVVHEAGALACSGRLTQAYAGEGDCRFTPDAGFERRLAAHGVAPESAREALAMLMVDATVGLAEGLIREGLTLTESGHLIAAAALKVSPAYLRELRVAGLRISAIDDAIACRAMGIDGPFVRGLVDAGYRRLTAEEAISMKALGVTPDYARKMNAAAAGRAR